VNRNTLVDIGEITDSREVLAEKPHRAMSLFAYLLIALLAAAVVWMCVGEIDYYVKAQGEVRPNEAVGTVRAAVTGRVTESNLEEGKSVRRGDTLFRVDAQSQLNTVEILRRQHEDISAEMQSLERLRESVIAGENLFDPGDAEQSDYYYKYQKYVTDTALAAEQVRNTNLDVERLRSDARVSGSLAEESRGRTAAELDALRLLRDSLECGENLVPPENAEQHMRYADYELTLERYDEIVRQRTSALDRAEKLFEAGGAAQKDLDNARFELDSALLEIEKYKNETLLSVEQGVTALEKNLNDLDASIRSAQAVLSSVAGRGYSEELTAEKSKLDMLASISDTLFSLQSNLDALQKDLDALTFSADETRAVAPIDGTLSLYTELNVGDFIQSGAELAVIIPASGGDHKVSLAISNADIADIAEGQEIHYRFAALPFGEYGEMTGRITKISTDARSDNSGRSYYLAEAELDGSVLYDKNGKSGEIKVGMTAEARVITKSRRIIYWVLEKLDFIN
jgi:HlyD family secretion protein